MAVPDCSQPVSPFQILWSPFYPQKPAPIVIRITVQPADSDGVAVSWAAIAGSARYLITHGGI
jgi:hypothetical protein